ncbi:predicted protein [Nematostella vectensis]|uniref:Serine-protein kinase ATM n=1 Tax=Nematostella vectensis TaxID=45351 RepID=A7SIS1_NEMVE|nr:predicted protein [Nematostella vectensis]|eukprot:XP_001628467.1 predicted protein [Nematostella vectensis]
MKPFSFLRESDPEPNPPFFTSYAIKATLEYMTRCYPGETVVSVLCKNKDNIQKILLALTTRIADSHLPYERRRVLSMYRLFVLLVIQELSNGLRNTWAFFIRDVIYSLSISFELARINCGLETEAGMFSPCCNLMHYLCEAAIQCCSQELGSHLHIIVSTLMPYASGHDERATQALSLLRYLIVECTPSLLDAIPLLDPFPDLPQFKELNDAYLSVKSRRRGTFLAQEISQFVSVSPRSPPLSRLEGLRHLRHLLATNKLALYGLLRCDKACSSPTIVSDLIHELISLSAQLNSVHTSTATHIKVAIADCLGEIGPVDLASVALAGRQVQDPLLPSTELLQGDPIVCRNSTIVGLLNRYLTDKSVKVVHAASDCLKRVLATPSGINLLKMYEQHQAEKLLWYLEPFKPARKRKVNVEMAEDFMTVLGRDELWLPTRGGVGIDHATWITDLTSVIITSGAVKDEMLRLLAPVCKVKVEFAEQVLPFLVHNILEQEAANENEASRDLLSGQVGALFVHYNEASSAPDPNNRATKGGAFSFCVPLTQSIRTILKVTNHLRTQPRPKARGQGSSTPWDNNFWLDLDYLEAAKAAQKCTAHFTALMYTEIWCDVQRSLPENPMNITLPTRSQDIEVDSASQSTDGGLSTSYQSLLVDIYSSIAELDSVYGVGAGRLADLESRIRTYEHEELWEKAVGAYDLRMQESPTAQIGMLKALKNFGLYHVMDNYLRGIPPDSLRTSPEVAELQFESAWRNCTWDIDTSLGSDVSRRPGFHQSLHTCLSALGDGEESLFRITLENAKLRVVSEVSHVSLESARSIYPNMVRLQQLTELQQYTLFFTRSVFLPKPQACDTNELVNKWKERFPLPDNDFIFVEPVLALRTAALHMLARVNSRQGREVLGSIYQVLVGHLESQAKLARQAGKPQVAEKALFAIRHLHTDAQVVQSVGGHVPGAWRMEEARLRWSRGETETAMHLLKCLTKQLQAVCMYDEEEIRLYPQALGLYGSWMAETRSENPNKIIEEYLEKHGRRISGLAYRGESDVHIVVPNIDAYLSLARYADTQYQNIVDYMKSSDFENKQEIARDAKSEYNRLSKVVARPERDKYIRTLMVESEIDEEELRLMEDSKMNFLQKALENYAKTLQAGDKYDLRVFRLCSLWFDNCKTSFVDDIMKDSISRIQSRKFLPLMYQLAARLGMRSSQDDAFQATLGQLIERTCVDHPHHTLLILIALVNADRDREYTAPSRRNGRDSRASRNASKETKGFIDEARLEAASALIESISHQRGQLVQMTKSLCLAYIELAYWEVGHLKGKTGPFDIKDTLAIKKMNNLRHVAVPTSDIKVDPLCRYEEIVYVDRFMPTFSLAGGVNLPKIIACVGSDGVKRRQLVKGRDDLRQDAVMEQVFGMVNQLLANNTETRKRKLRVRTYKVIPLSQRSGMLEWCEGTMPLGEYLIGSPGHNTGAHQRYNPRDWSPMDCRRKMASVVRNYILIGIMDHFKPVFRHFFLEKFVDPAEWFERRLAYTRSCATSSIVGYIVGLGDRHVQNILVDCNSAELVHIDLGVAFEQGKVLPTPETVPFRLTRDLVDGMGVTGVEGVFRRCCEKTMAVMRTSQEALVTILEVLLYDPLYSWTLSPEKKMALQATKPDNDVSEISSTAVDLVGDLPNGENTENGASVGNKMAERVLSRLKQKLNGIEDNTQLSVTGQVNHLIRQAMDVKNLCRLFPGWQPWV